MLTDTPSGNPAFRSVRILDRPDIADVMVAVLGVWSDEHQTRGAQIVTTVLFRSGEVDRTVFDYLAGWAPTEGYGGHDVAGRLVQHAMDNAEAWLVENLQPPCSVEAS